MSCSSSKQRIAAALAASAALHALLVAGLQQSVGSRWGGFSWEQFSAPIRAVLVSDQAAPAPPAAEPVAPNATVPSTAASESAPRSLLPQPHYFLTRELDVRPGIMTRTEPGYPEAAARRFLSGRVVVRLYIAESGTVDRVEILNAEPPGYFEDSAERAFLAARFSPGMKNGRPVKAQMTLEVNFDSADAPKLPGG
ncbi:MAG: energy transducer TonB [Betaproteobacteria bacterium]